MGLKHNPIAYIFMRLSLITSTASVHPEDAAKNSSYTKKLDVSAGWLPSIEWTSTSETFKLDNHLIKPASLTLC